MTGIIRTIQNAWCWVRGSCRPLRVPNVDTSGVIRRLEEQERASRRATEHMRRRNNVVEAAYLQRKKGAPDA